MSLWHADIRMHGTVDKHFSFPPGTINRHTHVVCSVCEISQPQGEPLDFPFQGSSSMWIDNIVPLDDGTLSVRVANDWGSDLNMRVFFNVFD